MYDFMYDFMYVYEFEEGESVRLGMSGISSKSKVQHEDQGGLEQHQQVHGDKLKRQPSAIKYLPRPSSIARVPNNENNQKYVNRKVREKERDPNSLETVGNHAWSGAVAGLIAESLMHPFDTISTRLKVQDSSSQRVKYHGLIGTGKTMVREEGVKSLFNGVSATALCALPSSAIYFGVYEWVKARGLDSCTDEDDLQADIVHLSAGACSELASSVVVVPFEVVKSRLQIGGSEYRGAIHGLSMITTNEGMAGLYAGYRACLMCDCVFSGLQFFFYERLRRLVKDRRSNQRAVCPDHYESFSGQFNSSISAGNSLMMVKSAGHDDDNSFDIVEDTAEDFAIGACSGGFAAFLSNPLDVAAARLMTQRDGKYEGTMDCLRRVARQEGMRGLWSGSAARVLSIVPLSALTFAIYEKMKVFLFQKSTR